MVAGKDNFGAEGFRPGGTGLHGEAEPPEEADFMERTRPRLASVAAGMRAREALSSGDLEAAEKLLGAVPKREEEGLKRRLEALKEDRRANERLRMVVERNRIRRALRKGG